MQVLCCNILHTRTQKTGNFYDARVINKWNKLPESVIHAALESKPLKTDLTTMREMHREEAPL